MFSARLKSLESNPNPFSSRRLVKARRVEELGARQKSTKTKEVNESDLCIAPSFTPHHHHHHPITPANTDCWRA